MFIDGSPESFHLSFLDWPRYYDIRSLPREVKEKANLIYNKFIDELDNQRLKDHFKKILIYLYLNRRDLIINILKCLFGLATKTNLPIFDI